MAAINPCIIVADRARARLFSLEKLADEPSPNSGRRLREHFDLVNPEAKVSAEKIFRDRKNGGRNRSAVVGGGYGTDDGKQRERTEIARKFAAELAKEIAELVKVRRAKELVLVASPKFLGVLRQKVRQMLPRDVDITALDEDLSLHPLSRIEQVLTRRGVLAPRSRRPAASP